MADHAALQDPRLGTDPGAAGNDRPFYYRTFFYVDVIP